MERKISLNGKWDLFYSDEINSAPLTLETFETAERVDATVPGNCQLDLSAAGILPAELFKGLNIWETEKFEPYGWWYKKEFDTPKRAANEKMFLQFGAVDCVAEYFLNGVRVFESDNAHITHEFDITDYVNESGKNTLVVHIFSDLKYELESPYSSYLLQSRGSLAVGLHLRKPRHCFGWDIMPRAVASGIWKDVNIVLRDEYSFENMYYRVIVNDKVGVQVKFYCSVNAPAKDLIDGSLTIKLDGKCGEDSTITAEGCFKRAKATMLLPTVENPKLWWPYGYGEANIYDTEVTLWKDGKLLAKETLNIGLRQLTLERTELLSDENPRFHFIINNEEIFCRGSNWVPLNVFHSQDKLRTKEALELATDVGCNILRIWGGGVYESDEFYDYCDRHGILIWHDFMMACQYTPMEEEFMKKLEKEFTFEVLRLRNHPSIALWSGDNEVDMYYYYHGLDTKNNRITRSLLPRIIADNDPYRPYLESSPYVNSIAKKQAEKIDLVNAQHLGTEQHLWGARDYFKADFFKQSKACFVSETGYYGCSSVESIKKTVDEDSVWPVMNQQWGLHSTNPNGFRGRILAMTNQIKQMFGIEPDNLDDYVFASQISQAEAKKYFIERMRVKRPHTGGIMWWNLLDGWPQMSDAVVGYFFDKKIAYYYIKRAQAPFAIMLDEMHDWVHDIYAANDTLKPVSGKYEISDIETGEVLISDEFTVKPNCTKKLSDYRGLYYSDKKMLLIKWEIDGKTYYNHYLCGTIPYDIEKYKAWYKKLAEICGE